MKLWHLVFAVFLASLALAISREEVGRVTLVVFCTAMGVIVLGVSSLLLLFRTVGSLGSARGVLGHLEAIAATTGVLFFGGAGMLAVLWFGASVVRMVIK